MRRNRFRYVGSLVLVGVACWSAAGQPRNDLCPDAPLIGLGAVEGDTRGATPNGSATCGASNTSPDVYYRFTAPATCQFEVLTCDGNTDFDTVVSIHSACPASSANQIVCSNDGCGSPRSRAVFDAARGVTYVIRVAGASGDSGTFTLVVRQLGRPLNDTCATAQVITGVTGSISADTTCAASEGVQTCGQGNSTGSANLYYRWTAPSNGVITFDTCAGASFSTYLSASTDCPHTNLNLVGCNRIACGTGSIMEFGAVEGASYIIRVGGRNGEHGTFTLSWTFQPSGFAPNDSCHNAQRFSLGSVRGSTTNSTLTTALSCPAGFSRDIFYVFNSPVEAFVTIDTCSPETTFDTVLSVHSSCPAADNNRIACSDNACGTSASVTFAAKPGRDYYVRLAGANAAHGAFVLNARAEVDAIVFDPSTLGEYYLLRDQQDMAQFRSVADALGAHMAAPTSFSENEFITRSVMGHNNVVRSVAIGLGDELFEGAFHWDSGEPLDYTFFLDGQPDNFNGAEDLVHIADPVTGLWNDYPFGAFRGLFGVAESDRDILDWVVNPANGHVYLLFRPSSWHGAQARARAMGGNLVSISDAQENEFVRARFESSTSGRDLWLGMTDADHEGVFSWVDGSSVTYTNFAQGEPNNFGGDETYVEMRISTGQWNDVTNLQLGSPNHGVAELVLPHVIEVAHGPGGCGTYALLSPSSFYPAEFFAYARLYGYVTAIGSAEENEFVRRTFAQPAGGRRIWLGARDLDDEGNFQWLYESFNYSNFAPGEPDNAGNQDHVVMNPDGTWSDVSSVEPGVFYAVIELWCQCDWDATGTYTSQDLFSYLPDFFNDEGDVNCDGVTNSQDFFDFLACLLSHCD